MQIIKITHKILNNKENYYIKDLLTNNRERKTLWENKVGPLKDKYGNLTMEQNSYLYKTIAAYNKIPKEITLIIKDSIFKKWIKRYFFDKNDTPKKIDKKYEEKNYYIDTIKIEYCYQEYG